MSQNNLRLFFVYINSRHLRQSYLRHILDVNNVVNKELSEERLVLGIIKQDPSTSAKKIGEIINKSERSIQRILSDLKQKRIIERIGNTKGYWKINVS